MTYNFVLDFIYKMKIRNQTTLYFIRHGETASNAKGIQQGNKIDDYLDTHGVLQIQAMAKLITKLDLDMLFTSYLHRAEETTALIYKELSEPVQILHDYRLRERNFGSLSGKTKKEWESVLPNQAELEAMQMYDYRPFGGESVEDVRQRAVSAILDIIQNYDHKNIGIITHAGIIRLLLFHFPDIPRIYHQHEENEKEIGNSDIYEWEINSSRIANLKSLLK
jgi:broad specificity phosphatase PhoE